MILPIIMEYNYKKIEYNLLYSIFFMEEAMAIYETATKLANEIKSSKEYTQFKKYMQEVKRPRK